MATRAQVIDCARTWIGTPWKHQQRLKGEACDCAGLVIGVAAEVFGIRVEAPPYGHTPHHGTLEKVVSQYMVRKHVSRMMIADVLLISWDEEPQHMAIVSEIEGQFGLIHAWMNRRRVVEHLLDKQWRDRIRIVFEFPGIE